MVFSEDGLSSEWWSLTDGFHCITIWEHKESKTWKCPETDTHPFDRKTVVYIRVVLADAGVEERSTCQRHVHHVKDVEGFLPLFTLILKVISTQSIIVMSRHAVLPYISKSTRTCTHT